MKIVEPQSQRVGHRHAALWEEMTKDAKIATAAALHYGSAIGRGSMEGAAQRLVGTPALLAADKALVRSARVTSGLTERQGLHSL